jgi:hypothetical protein
VAYDFARCLKHQTPNILQISNAAIFWKEYRPQHVGGALEDRIKPQVLADLKRLREIKQNKVSAEIEAAESCSPASCMD